jgi:hypothetical protein
MQTKKFVAAVGAFLGALVALLCALADAGPEVYTLAMSVVGSLLALWRSATPPGVVLKRDGFVRPELLGAIGAFALLVVFVFGLTVLGGCPSVTTNAKKTTQIDVWPDACRMTVDADGVRVFELTSEPGVACVMQCQTPVAPKAVSP